jgi:pSer/pThr/pTyr-binding forkhead associated (FHA) protein
LIVQLRILSCKDAGALHVIRRFPCLIGRCSGADVRLEQAGVWDRHLELKLDPQQGIAATVLPGALATLNGEPFDRHRLRNGDVIEFGGAKIQFWLAPTRQRSFVLRERLTWVALGVLCAGQIALIYYLLQ